MLEKFKSFEAHKIFDRFQIFWNFRCYLILMDAAECWADLEIVVISKLSDPSAP